jgi:hypothetical protein
MGKAVGAYHVEDYDYVNFTRRNKSKWSTASGAVDGGSVGISARPIRNLYRGEGYVYFPGVAGNAAITNESENYDFIAGFEIFIRTRLIYASGNTQRLCAQGATGSTGFSMGFAGDGRMIVTINDGTSNRINTSTVGSVGVLSDDTAYWFQFTFDPAGAVFSASYQADNGTNTPPTSGWTFYGSTSASPFTINPNVVKRLVVGASNNINTAPVRGLIRAAIFRNAPSGGTTLAKWEDSLVASQTGYIDPDTSAVWTIQRSASGLKTAVVNKLTGSHMLYGANRFAEVNNNTSLNFGVGEEFTIAVLQRIHGNPPSTQAVVTKRDTVSTAAVDAGWFVRRESGSQQVRCAAGDGTVVRFVPASITTSAARQLIGIQRDLEISSSGGLVTFVDATKSTASTSLGDLGNAFDLRVGRGGGTSGIYADMEETFSAIFRNALTPAQLTRLKWEAETFARKF